MQHLVTGDYVEAGAAASPRSTRGDAPPTGYPLPRRPHGPYSGRKACGRGYSAGERAGAFIFEADSNEELDAMLQGLPYRGLIQFRVTPLEGIEDRRERDRQQADQIEQMPQP